MHLEGIDYRGYLNVRTHGFWQATCAEDWRLHVKQNQTANDLILDSFVALMRGAIRDLMRREELAEDKGPSHEGAIRMGQLFVRLCSEIARVKVASSVDRPNDDSSSDEKQLTRTAEELKGAKRLYGFASHLLEEVSEINKAANDLSKGGANENSKGLKDLKAEMQHLQKSLEKSYLFEPENAETYIRLQFPGDEGKQPARDMILAELNFAFIQGRDTAKHELSRFKSQMDKLGNTPVKDGKRKAKKRSGK